MHSRTGSGLKRAFGLLFLAGLGSTTAVPRAVQAQARGGAVRPMAGTWKVDPKISLAWWQVNPHFDHLWATSCPGDPAWMPGDGNTGGYAIDKHKLPKGYRGMAKVLSPPQHIPLFPRQEIKAICGEAVQGEVVLPRADSWDGATGTITVHAADVITGNDNRDNYMFNIIETKKYPEFTFKLEKIENAQVGDTLHATAVGTFTIRGIDREVSVPVKAWREAEGVRVTGKFMIPAAELLQKYNMSKFKLGLGVGSALWKELHMGFDVILLAPTT